MSDQDSSRRSYVFVGTLDLNISSLRMSEHCPQSKTGSARFWRDCAKSGMMRNGKLYQRPSSAPHTKENESGLWPTPTVNGNHNKKGLSKTSGDGLATFVDKMEAGLPVTKKSGQLNPTWVEWLMGFPKGWTDLNA